MLENYVPPALFVTWQDPTTRSIHPVGRLARIASPHHHYEFCYLKAAEAAIHNGFSPFVTFPDLDEVYHSRELPPFFENRVLKPARADFLAQLTELGLPPDASREEILARTNGRRATDPYELFSEFEPNGVWGEWKTQFFARSMRYLAHPEELNQLQPGQALRCMLDVQNPVDVKAIALRTDGNELVGFCPAYLVDELAPLLSEPSAVRVTVARLNAPPAPLQHRLQCQLLVRPNAEFHAYRLGRYEPIAPNALRLSPWTIRARVA